MRRLFVALGVAALMGVLAGCSTVPITGRTQLDLVPSSSLLSMSRDQYAQFLHEHKLGSDPAETRMVHDVGQRVARAVEDYLRGHQLAAAAAEFSWEFNLVNDKAANAWAMPGGKVVVYTGIMPVVKDESGLATVLAHEIGHVVARHGNERMSQALLAQFGGLALATALESKPQETQQLWMAAYGAGAQYGILLPYSRLQEYEADKLGLVFMSMAGFDPSAAVAFWERMAAQNKGGAPPELLSTHPTDANRIARIREFLPEARTYRRPR